MKFKHLCHSLWATNHPPSPWQKAVQSGEGRLDFLCISACATAEKYSFCFPYLLQAASVNNETFVMQVFGQSKSKPWVTTCYKHSFAANLQNKTEQNTLELSIWNQQFAMHRTKPCPWPESVCSSHSLPATATQCLTKTRYEGFVLSSLRYELFLYVQNREESTLLWHTACRARQR